jgi:curved DNA-binding protein CbpA
MCIISDKIKFCTCANTKVEKLKHYWILYRCKKEKNEMCVGEPMMPTYMSDLNFSENEAALVKRLNEPDAFDVPIKFQSKDQLEIVINNNNSSIYGTFTYSFEFKKNKWVAIETDPFNIMNHFEEEKAGKIKNALKRKL